MSFSGHFLLFLAAAAGFPLLVLAFSGYVELRLAPLGFANLALLTGLLLWYLADTLYHRRTIYRFFGRDEPVIRPGLRLWRRVVTLTAAMAAVAHGIAMLSPQIPGEHHVVPPAALPPLTVVTAALLATLGWMYTAFEKEKTDRAAHTLATIRSQLSGDYLLTVHSQLVGLTQHVERAKPFPLDQMNRSLADLPRRDRPRGRPSTSVRSAAVQFLNELDHIALGVRRGQFDFRSIQLLLRERFVRTAFRFSEFIADETDAQRDETLGRPRSTRRTWQDFLWLVGRMNVFDGDQVDASLIVLPPLDLD